INISINIEVPPDEVVQVVQNAADSNNLMLLVKPIEFNITCEYEGQTVEVPAFNTYVERLIAIPEGVDPEMVTTAAVLSDDGKSFTQVPTIIVWIDGKPYAKINSLSNSIYALIYNNVEFADVANHWAKDIINIMGSKLIVNGVGKGNYNPDSDITRAEFAVIICRALGLKEKAYTGSFKDIKASDWYSDYIEIAASYGIITGYADHTFRPNDKITREQTMAMIHRAMKITGLSPELTENEISMLIGIYKDGSSVSAYARPGVAACLETGVVNGKGAAKIAPKDNITRAEVAVIVYRLLIKSSLI
ncbi:MAG: S-layer homology domain-containing protein, partial [Eubacteriales bacterium]|nr:S-layer homology domain-containing protein [Eubacteriales bacterium]